MDVLFCVWLLPLDAMFVRSTDIVPGPWSPFIVIPENPPRGENVTVDSPTRPAAGCLFCSQCPWSMMNMQDVGPPLARFTLAVTLKWGFNPTCSPILKM